MWQLRFYEHTIDGGLNRGMTAAYQHQNWRTEGGVAEKNATSMGTSTGTGLGGLAKNSLTGTSSGYRRYSIMGEN